MSDGPDLLIVDVAPVLVRPRHAGVRNDGRARGHGAGLEKTAAVDVREIDDDRSGFATAYELLAPRGQPFAVAPAGAVSGITCFVGAEVQKPEVTDAAA